MTELLPPLTGGYPTIGLVMVTWRHTTAGWVLLASDSDGCHILGQGPAHPETH